MPRRIAGMLRNREHWNDRAVSLRGPQLQERILRIPAGQCGVVLCDRFPGICACRPGRVGVLMVLEDFSLYLLQPGLEKSGLPEPGQVVGGVRALEILIGRILSIRIARAEYRRGSGAGLVAGRQHPPMPRAGKWSHRGRTAPNARRRGKRARESLI